MAPGFVTASKELPAFSDVSSGYGSVVYLRLTGTEGHHYLSFLIGKARVSPVKPTNIPPL